MFAGGIWKALEVGFVELRLMKAQVVGGGVLRL